MNSNFISLETAQDINQIQFESASPHNDITDFFENDEVVLTYPPPSERTISNQQSTPPTITVPSLLQKRPATVAPTQSQKRNVSTMLSSLINPRSIPTSTLPTQRPVSSQRPVPTNPNTTTTPSKRPITSEHPVSNFSFAPNDALLTPTVTQPHEVNNIINGLITLYTNQHIANINSLKHKFSEDTSFISSDDINTIFTDTIKGVQNYIDQDSIEFRNIITPIVNDAINSIHQQANNLIQTSNNRCDNICSDASNKISLHMRTEHERISQDMEKAKRAFEESLEKMKKIEKWTTLAKKTT